MALGELAELVGGSLEGDRAVHVAGVARLEEAGGQQLSFCALIEYRGRVETTAAAAVIVPRDFDRPPGARPDLALIRVDNPYLAVRAAVLRMYPETRAPQAVHPSAVIDPRAELADGVGVGAHAVIAAGVRIGPGSEIGAGSVVGEGCEIGADCRLHANVTLYPRVRLGDRVIVHAGAVLGADGFGYATEGGSHYKIPQVGGVVIEDDVEIGAGTCIDRAALGVTRVGRGSKIDNLVQIGHNCDVGADTILCGQVGLGGSTVIGNQVMVGGQAGFRGHLRVGDGAMIAGGSGVTGPVAAGAKVAGYPHMEASRWRRMVAAVRALPELLRRVRRLEAALADSRKEDE
jgi:UDP-3-O-[3-hydroxymyristoyl] glucosamine N-acyltransferase